MKNYLFVSKLIHAGKLSMDNIFILMQIPCIGTHLWDCID